jgi:UDP-glucuronate 4-epimerase
MDFINIIEEKLGKKAKIKFLPMQVGDIKETHADNRLLSSLTGFTPGTSVAEGVSRFVDWYMDYHGLE